MEVSVSGFSPAPDEVTKRLGPAAGVVFGKVWRYCQMERGQCEVGLERIGRELGLSWNTVSEAIEKLCSGENAYLEKIETGAGIPNIYRHTGKFVMKLTVEENSIPTQKLNTSPSITEGLPPQLLRQTPSETEGKDSIRIASKKEKTKIVKPSAQKPRDPLLDNPAVILFKEKSKRTPNEDQRRLIAAQVNGNIAEWGDVVSHWVGHGWNKSNVISMLEFLKNGGVPACTACNRQGNKTQPAAPQPKVVTAADIPTTTLTPEQRAKSIAALKAANANSKL